MKKINIGINEKYFNQNKFGLDYSKFYYSLIDEFETNKSDYNYDGELLFKPNYTKNGLFLRYDDLELGVLGFNLINNSRLDILQIQGGRKKYKYLNSIRWDQSLIDGAIKYARKLNLDEVSMIPSYLVEGDIDISKANRYLKRYDLNARLFGFNYIKNENRFIFEIRD